MQRILLALCLSLAVSSGLMLALGHRLKAQPQQARIISYIAPARVIAAGELLQASDLESVPWPENLPLADASPKSDGFVGRTALVPIAKDQPLLASYVSAPGAGTGLAARIPDGMRAVALRSDEIVGVGGFLHPGSHVDVLVTCKLRADLDLSTVTALENAEVIATGQRSQPDPSGKPESVTVVTLLLTPENAERAVIAASQGSVHFVLRNNSDTAASTPSPMKLSSLAGTVPVPKSAAPKKAQILPATRTPEPGIETVLDGSAQNANSGVQGMQ